MYVEVLYHSTFIPKLNRLSILRNISETKRFLEAFEIYGCTLIHGDEVLHLFQGEEASIVQLKTVLFESFRDFHIQELGADPLKRKHFDRWEVYSDDCESSAIMFQENSIDRARFEENYLKNSKVRSKVFPFVAESILERKPLRRAI